MKILQLPKSFLTNKIAKRLILMAIALFAVMFLFACSYTKVEQEKQSVFSVLKEIEVSDLKVSRISATLGKCRQILQLKMREMERIKTNATTEPVVPDNTFVRVRDYIPRIKVELKYATTDNFTGKIIYDFDEAYLRYGTVMKLKNVQEELEELGMGLKIWDAYRPQSGQWALWNACPNPAYVADPNGGITSHTRGDTIDITLVYEDGTEVLMPTGFDDFSAKADRNYSDVDSAAAENALLLQRLMYKHGFTGYHGEWWDYSDTVKYWANTDFKP